MSTVRNIDWTGGFEAFVTADAKFGEFNWR